MGVTSSKLVDDVVAGDAVAFGGEIHDEAMPQHRLGQGADVFEGDVRPAVNERAGFGAENQELRGPRAGAPGELFASEIGSTWLRERAFGGRGRACSESGGR